VFRSDEQRADFEPAGIFQYPDSDARKGIVDIHRHRDCASHENVGEATFEPFATARVECGQEVEQIANCRMVNLEGARRRGPSCFVEDQLISPFLVAARINGEEIPWILLTDFAIVPVRRSCGIPPTGHSQTLPHILPLSPAHDNAMIEVVMPSSRYR
jgi:hypothetical protein